MFGQIAVSFVVGLCFSLGLCLSGMTCRRTSSDSSICAIGIPS
jgi:hypothetical protein